MNDSGYKLILAYAVTITLVIAITKTRIGYTIVYYTLVLSLLLLLVINAKFINDTLSPIGRDTNV